jgi:hypothetical protein
MLERHYQAKLIKKLEELFPGCMILKNDPEYLPGVPDLLILWGGRWAMLECKASETSPVRPNQPYYVELFNAMSFAAFIYPSNETEILRGLQRSFSSDGDARVPFSE